MMRALGLFEHRGHDEKARQARLKTEPKARPSNVPGGLFQHAPGLKMSLMPSSSHIITISIILRGYSIYQKARTWQKISVIECFLGYDVAVLVALAVYGHACN